MEPATGHRMHRKSVTNLKKRGWSRGRGEIVNVRNTPLFNFLKRDFSSSLLGCWWLQTRTETRRMSQRFSSWWETGTMFLSPEARAVRLMDLVGAVPFEFMLRSQISYHSSLRFVCFSFDATNTVHQSVLESRLRSTMSGTSLVVQCLGETT